ncbi:MAG: hypothetical protein NVS4B12_06170 [Ktedonobacteraceae bacterium]
MDETQQSDMDGPSVAEYNDAQISDLYINGLISRVEADVYDIIADFNGDQRGTPYHE